MGTATKDLRLESAPLRFRLPNPPPVFVGREREKQLLREAFLRAPATLVCGPGGMGKTSLVLSMLHQEPSTTLERVVCVSASEADRSGEQLLRDLMLRLSVLVGAGLGRVPSGSSEALLAQVVDLADACRAVVVLEDLHWMESALGQDLLNTAGRYARKSRWVGTSRSALPLEEEQILFLAGLSDDALLALARTWAPQLDQRDARLLVGQAGGSPFWLRQSLQQRRLTKSARTRGALLSGLSENVRRWVEQASWLEHAIPEEATDLGMGLTSHELRELEQSGLVEWVAEGLRVHAVARSIIVDPEHGNNEALCRYLRDAPNAWLQLEAARLDLGAGRLAVASTALEKAADELIDRGLSPVLWQLLESVHDRRFLRVKLLCAIDLGGGPALAWASEQPAPSEPLHRVLLVEALVRSPQLTRAAREAAELGEELEKHAPELAARAWLALCHASTLLSNPETLLMASDRVSRLAGDSADLLARVGMWRARALAFQGRTSEALAVCASLDELVTRTQAATRSMVDEQRSAVYFSLGRTKRAWEMFQRSARDGLVSLEQFGVQMRLVRSTLFALEFGELAEARRLLDELAIVADRAEGHAAFYAKGEFRYATTMGQLGLAEDHLVALVAAISGSNGGYWSGWLASPRHYLGILQASPLVSELAASESDFPLTRAMGAWHEVRSTGKNQRLSALAATDVTDADIVRHLALANWNTLEGRPAVAMAEAHCAESLARQEGLLLWRADALLVLAETVVATGEGAQDPVLARLRKLTKELGPSRYDDELRFFEEVARGADADLTIFDRLSQTGSLTAPARRSRRILGFEAACDRIDQLICDRVRGRLAKPTVIATGSGARWALGLDSRRCRVLLPEGTVLDLGKKPVAMKILLTLFEGGGNASKEALVRGVWQTKDYHPLRDDKRLQVAIRRLRVLLGQEHWLETTEDGYRLAPEVSAYLA